MPICAIDTDGRLEPFVRAEWLLTNGTGAFASGTLVGCNTRRYHSVLVAATVPPVGRVNTIARLDESIDLGAGHIVPLSVSRFDAGYHPRGYEALRRVEVGRTVTWHYEADGARVTRELLLCWGKNVSAVRYVVAAPPGRDADLSVRPFAALRDFHACRHGGHIATQASDRGVVLRDGDLIASVAGIEAPFEAAPDWWWGHEFDVDHARGLDHREDQFTPGRWRVRAAPGSPATLTLWFFSGELPETLPSFEAEKADVLEARELPPHLDTAAQKRLAHAAQDFVVARRQPDGAAGTTVMAGYPWFSDWGRDTMISLPGLLLTTRRFDEARKVLRVFADYVSEGMIPNVFDDYTNEPAYNTVDASLWFIHACHEYRAASGDDATFSTFLLPACRAIIRGYTEGTRYHIRVDPEDGLVTQGDASTQLTWMDAKHGGIAFTPRQGKAVEINALWYHALVLLGETDRAARVGESFRKQYWLSPFRGLADVVDGTRRDTSVRPNQIFAVSLPNSPLDAAQQRAVVEVVRRELLTPFGIRTLSRADPRYRARFEGGPAERDSAYHNGTVWPWLIGPFCEAHLRAESRSEQSLADVRGWLRPLIDQMTTGGCINSVSENYDGDAPQRPAGCFAQAWSVAELLRLAVAVGL